MHRDCPFAKAGEPAKRRAAKVGTAFSRATARRAQAAGWLDLGFPLPQKIGLRFRAALYRGAAKSRAHLGLIPFIHTPPMNAAARTCWIGLLELPTMKAFPFLLGLLACAVSASASEIKREVARSSPLERELGYTVTVQDKHDAWRAQGLEKVFPIKGPAAEYLIRFEAKNVGRLKSLFGMYLTLGNAKGVVANVPVETRSKFADDLAYIRRNQREGGGESAEREISVELLLNKEWIDRATLTIRCGTGLAEESYVIRLKDYAPNP